MLQFEVAVEAGAPVWVLEGGRVVEAVPFVEGTGRALGLELTQKTFSLRLARRRRRAGGGSARTPRKAMRRSRARPLLWRRATAWKEWVARRRTWAEEERRSAWAWETSERGRARRRGERRMSRESKESVQVVSEQRKRR